MFCNGQTGQSNTCTGSRGLVHLAVNQRSLGAFSAAFLVHAGFDHFPVKVVTFTSTLANTCEHGVTAVRLGDVVDQFHDENGLAHAGAAEQADLTALCVRSEKVNDLDARHKDFSFGGLFDELRSVLVDRTLAFVRDLTSFIDRLADHVHDTAQGAVANRHHDRCIGVDHFLTAHQTLGGVHRDVRTVFSPRC